MRRSIALMITSGLLPVIALGGGFGFLTLRAEHEAVRNGADVTARFAATLVATRLGDGMRSVNMIAQSPMFDAHFDPAAFRILALRLKDHDSAWRTLSAADAAGHRLLDVPHPIGGEMGGPVVDKASFDRTIATRRPVGDDHSRDGHSPHKAESLDHRGRWPHAAAHRAATVNLPNNAQRPS